LERLTGVIRRVVFDYTLFWNASDLKKKLGEFEMYYYNHRVLSSLGGHTPGDFTQLSKNTKSQPYNCLPFGEDFSSFRLRPKLKFELNNFCIFLNQLTISPQTPEQRGLDAFNEFHKRNKNKP